MQKNAENKFKSGYFLLGVGILIFILLAARRPDLLFHAQFWAEDGREWYGAAYNYGVWHSLFIPMTGYFQTFSRLVASFSLFFPLLYAPLVYNIVALFVRAATFAFFLGSRFNSVPLLPRVIVVIYAILLPNVSEVHANITNTHWYLALYAFLIVIAQPRKGWGWGGHDFAITFLAAISGPTPFFILPCLLLKFWSEEGVFGLYNIKKIVRFVAAPGHVGLVLGTSIQLVCVFVERQSRVSLPMDLGASFTKAMKIISSRILNGFFPDSVSDIPWHHPVVAFIIVALFFLFVLKTFTSGGWRLSSTIVFFSLLVAAALYKPIIAFQPDVWALFEAMGAAGRYFILPQIMLFGVVAIGIYAYVKTDSQRKIYTGVFSIILLFVGVKFFFIPPMENWNWAGEVNKYNQAPLNTKVDLAIQPKGWFITLYKH